MERSNYMYATSELSLRHSDVQQADGHIYIVAEVAKRSTKLSTMQSLGLKRRHEVGGGLVHRHTWNVAKITEALCLGFNGRPELLQGLHLLVVG